jgi:phage I-like protein
MLSKIPPKEFRIFKSGWNPTYKGDFLFDGEAALAVMAEFEEHGVDRPIDLEHLSIEQESNAYDPNARGWFKLEVRNGELWAVDVKWTPDGVKRLTQATQRYISPFFGFDKKTRRVQSLYNVAICAIPATKDMPALVAASKRNNIELAALSIEADDMEMKKILSALGLGEDATYEDALGAIKAFQEDDGEGKEQMKKLRKMLKLADDSPFEDMESALKKLAIGGGDEDSGDSDPKRVVEEETSDDLNEDDKELAGLSAKMRGRFMALSSNVSSLTKRLEKIEKTQTVNEVDKLIAENTEKVPLHMESYLRAQGKKYGIEVVHEFLKHSISAPRAKAPPKQIGGGNSIEALKLTKEEKELAKLSGVSEKQQLEFKKARAEKDRERSGQQAD